LGTISSLAYCINYYKKALQLEFIGNTILIGAIKNKLKHNENIKNGPNKTRAKGSLLSLGLLE